MAYSLVDVVKDALTNNLEILPKGASDARFAICKDCPHFGRMTNRCAKCGCYMPVKTRLTRATCPVKKW